MFSGNLLIALALKIHNCICSQISQSSQSVCSIAQWIFPLEFLIGILNLTSSKIEVIFQLCICTRLCQLLCSIAQSRPLVILLDSDLCETKDIVYPAPVMGLRTEKALMLYLKKRHFSSDPTPINHQALSSLHLRYISKSVHFAQSFCQLLHPSCPHISPELLKQLLNLHSLHVFLSANPDSHSNQSDLQR